MSTLFEIIGGALLLIGSVFLFLGGLGIFRMPDVYNRLQAGTKATTLGGMSLILGVGFLMVETSWMWMAKAVIVVIFIAFSNPISSHALARAMYKRKRYPLITSKDENMDAYKEIVENEKKEEDS
ncbi:MAG: Na+/H+ antiporter subunit G [Bacteroidetes bacterium]|nr:MAG: Na+/H+ antiporter subunit G [Bacteroidota bacterium]